MSVVYIYGKGYVCGTPIRTDVEKAEEEIELFLNKDERLNKEFEKLEIKQIFDSLLNLIS